MEHSKPSSAESPDESPPRRTFLVRVTAGIAALIGLMVGVPVVGYTILPALRRRELGWADAGPVSTLPVGIPQEREIVLTVADGWKKTTTKKTIWVVKDEAGTVTVYSPICPHLGCGYRWMEGERRFVCPCHNSVFLLDGTVVAGPAPRPLDTLPFKLERGRLFVQYKEFKAGAAKKIEL